MKRRGALIGFVIALALGAAACGSGGTGEAAVSIKTLQAAASNSQAAESSRFTMDMSVDVAGEPVTITVDGVMAGDGKTGQLEHLDADRRLDRGAHRRRRHLHEPGLVPGRVGGARRQAVGQARPRAAEAAATACSATSPTRPSRTRRSRASSTSRVSPVTCRTSARRPSAVSRRRTTARRSTTRRCSTSCPTPARRRVTRSPSSAPCPPTSGSTARTAS